MGAGRSVALRQVRVWRTEGHGRSKRSQPAENDGLRLGRRRGHNLFTKRGSIVQPPQGSGTTGTRATEVLARSNRRRKAADAGEKTEGDDPGSEPESKPQSEWSLRGKEGPRL